MTSVTSDATMDLTPFINQIRDRCGLSFKQQTVDILRTAVKERMQTLELQNPAGYFSILQSREDEIQRLINLVTVNETYFLREPKHFEILTDHLIPALLKTTKPGGRISILSAGCSTGAEPYSILIALLEKFGDSILEKVNVIGVDLDSEALESARAARFGKHAFRGMDPRIQQDYFVPLENNVLEVVDRVKSQVEFCLGNLAETTLPGTLGWFDIIFYRNVSIYFDKKTQKEIFHNLARMLTGSGKLIMSSVEISFHDLDSLHLQEIEGVYMYGKSPGLKIQIPKPAPSVDGNATLNRTVPVFAKRTRPSRPAAKKSRSAHEERPPLRRGDARQDGERSVPILASKQKNNIAQERPPLGRGATFEDALALTQNDKPEEALRVLKALLESQPDCVPAYGLLAALSINLNRLDAAEQACRTGLALNESDLECHLLSGLVAKERGQIKEAQDWFRRAVFLESSCWLAHYQLAETASSRDQCETAAKHYNATLKLLDRYGLQNNGLAFFPLAFSADHLIHLCRHNLERLKTRH